MELKVFINNIKSIENTWFAIDCSVYSGNKYYNKCIYAFRGPRSKPELIGAYSDTQGGKLFETPIQSFSKAHRTFTKLDF